MLIKVSGQQRDHRCKHTWGHKFHENSGSVSEERHVEVAAQVSHLPQERDVAQMQ